MADNTDNSSNNDQLSFDAFAVDLMERIKKARAAADSELLSVNAAGIKKSKGRFKKEVADETPGATVTKTIQTINTETLTSATKPLVVELSPAIIDKPVAADPRATALTVGQLNREIKSIIEKKYANIWVKGEISNCKVYGSGHMYFTLKDSESQISAVMFNANSRLKFKVEDGMEVIVKGNVSLYLARGNHQLVCDLMEPVGFGALQLAYEQLKEKLQKEGLFDAARKRPLPAFPESIGLVTSPTGAAVRDMVNVLSRRMAGSTQVTVIPTSVQGEKASKEIVAAIELANRLAIFDVLIIGRGGGSIEDMWSFNTEEVVRAIAASKIPTISAVGHEVDFTIADFVADLRAPTPSAAAELVAKNKSDLIERIRLLTKQLLRQMSSGLEIKRHKFLTFAKGLIDPRQKLLEVTQRNDDLSHRLQMGMFRFIEDSRLHVELLTNKLPHPQVRFEKAARALEGLMGRLVGQSTRLLDVPREKFLKSAGMLDGLSPLKVLDRGYSIVLKSGQIVKNSGQIKAGDQVQITLSQGSAKAEIL